MFALLHMPLCTIARHLPRSTARWAQTLNYGLNSTPLAIMHQPLAVSRLKLLQIYWQKSKDKQKAKSRSAFTGNGGQIFQLYHLQSYLWVQSVKIDIVYSMSYSRFSARQIYGNVFCYCLLEEERFMRSAWMRNLRWVARWSTHAAIWIAYK